MNSSGEKKLSINKLTKLKSEFDQKYSSEYFSIIAPNSLKDWESINNINYYISQKGEIPFQILNDYKNLNLWIIEIRHITNIYKGLPLGFIKYSDFIKSK